MRNGSVQFLQVIVALSIASMQASESDPDNEQVSVLLMMNDSSWQVK